MKQVSVNGYIIDGATVHYLDEKYERPVAMVTLENCSENQGGDYLVDLVNSQSSLNPQVTIIIADDMGSYRSFDVHTINELRKRHDDGVVEVDCLCCYDY